jgi:hypothetical protein
MYAWIWRRLPGRRPAKLFGMLALLVGVLAVLFLVVFPTVGRSLPFNHVTVDRPAPSPSPVATVSGP